MRRLMIVMTVLLVLILPQTAVESQSSSTCPQLVTLALEATDHSFDALSSN